MKAIKKLIEVDRDKSETVKPLPFKPGSKVEVIVFPAKEEEDIFSYIDEVVKKKKIAPLSLKDVEKIVHEIRTI